MAINKVYQIGSDRFFGPIQVEKTTGNDTSVVLSINPEEPIIFSEKEFAETVQAVNMLMGWAVDGVIK